MTPVYSGTGSKLTVTPGQDIYFRTKAQGVYTASEIQHIAIPQRPATPAFAIDYTQEKTTDVIASDYQYGYQADLSDAVTGDGTKLTITPGTNVYFRKPGSSSSFASLIQTLAVPARPATPAYTINYATSRTNEIIPSGVDYSVNADMSGAISGTNAAISLTPGTDLYFKIRPTASSFCSGIFSLDVKQKPATPSFTLNFESETTAQNVGDIIEYADNSNFSGAVAGTGQKITVTPGQNLWFRQAATANSFCSDAFEMVVPERSSLDYLGTDTVTTNKIVLRAMVPEGYTFSLDNLMISNGTASNLRNLNAFDVTALSKGWVVVTIPVNAFSEGNFASNIVRVYYDNTSTGTKLNEEDKFNVYPNPVNKGRLCIQNSSADAYTLDIISGGGVLVKSFPLNQDKNQFIDIADLSKGIYILRFNGKNQINIQKLIVE
jgi:hypothetical protein